MHSYRMLFSARAAWSSSGHTGHLEPDRCWSAAQSISDWQQTPGTWLMATQTLPASICIECLRCRHRGIVDAWILQQHGLNFDVSLAALSRRLVCQACGSKAVRLTRADRE